MKTIRICEMEEALRMKEEGVFKEYLEMWNRKFPYEGLFDKIKRNRDRFNCSLRDAYRMTTRDEVNVDFEIGSDFILRKRNDEFSLLARVQGIWVEAADNYSIDDMTRCSDPFPNFRERVKPLCSMDEVMEAGKKGRLEALARKLGKRIREQWLQYSLFCGEEIWRTVGNPWYIHWSHVDRDSPVLRVYSKTGEETIPFTTKGIKNHLEKFYMEKTINNVTR